MVFYERLGGLLRSYIVGTDLLIFRERPNLIFQEWSSVLTYDSSTPLIFNLLVFRTNLRVFHVNPQVFRSKL